MCRYLQVEWDVKKKTPNSLKEKIRGSTPRVPQQTNFSDCGVYVLQYVESFFKVCTCLTLDQRILTCIFN